MLLKLYEQKAVELKEEILAMMEEKIAKKQMARKSADDRIKGIDVVISRTIDPKEIDRLQRLKKETDIDVNKELDDIENDFNKKEAKLTREVQGRTMEREAQALAQLTKHHQDEKKEIFEKYLPDELMRSFYNEFSKEENADLQKYLSVLEAEKEDKLREMEE